MYSIKIWHQRFTSILLSIFEIVIITHTKNTHTPSSFSHIKPFASTWSRINCCKSKKKQRIKSPNDQWEHLYECHYLLSSVISFNRLGEIEPQQQLTLLWAWAMGIKLNFIATVIPNCKNGYDKDVRIIIIWVAEMYIVYQICWTSPSTHLFSPNMLRKNTNKKMEQSRYSAFPHWSKHNSNAFDKTMNLMYYSALFILIFIISFINYALLQIGTKKKNLLDALNISDVAVRQSPIHIFDLLQTISLRNVSDIVSISIRKFLYISGFFIPTVEWKPGDQRSYLSLETFEK